MDLNKSEDTLVGMLKAPDVFVGTAVPHDRASPTLSSLN